jgi:hypothetical protein
LPPSLVAGPFVAAASFFSSGGAAQETAVDGLGGTQALR